MTHACKQARGPCVTAPRGPLCARTCSANDQEGGQGDEEAQECGQEDGHSRLQRPRVA